MGFKKYFNKSAILLNILPLYLRPTNNKINMKKIILTSCIALLAIGANAQKGSWYLGGNLGFNSTSHKAETGNNVITGPTVSTWTISPEVGTFLTDNIQFGIGLTNVGQRMKLNDSLNTITNNSKFGGTIYSRYFFGKGNFRPFVGANISILPGVMKTKTSIFGLSNTTTSNTFDFGANINVGFAYALSNKVSVLGSFGTVGYSSSSVTTNKTTVTTSNIGLDAGSLGNRFTIGVYFTICNPKGTFKDINDDED
jgi:hypothetical protein